MIKTNDLHVAVATLVVCFVSLNREKKSAWAMGGRADGVIGASVSQCNGNC